MQFQEYPKALYLAGAMAMAADRMQEADLREAGYEEWRADQQRMKHDAAAPKPNVPDTSALEDAKAQLLELETHLIAKDQNLVAKEQELAMREAQLAEAEAGLAARVAMAGTDADKVGDSLAPPPPADEKTAARNRKKQDAAQ